MNFWTFIWKIIKILSETDIFIYSNVRTALHVIGDLHTLWYFGMFKPVKILKLVVCFFGSVTFKYISRTWFHARYLQMVDHRAIPRHNRSLFALVVSLWSLLNLQHKGHFPDCVCPVLTLYFVNWDKDGWFCFQTNLTCLRNSENAYKQNKE